MEDFVTVFEFAETGAGVHWQEPIATKSMPAVKECAKAVAALQR